MQSLSTPTAEKPTFEEELRSLINKHSMENGSNSPDFMLASFLSGCLDSFDKAVSARDKWFRQPDAGQSRCLEST
jgi:hypothetical protein